MEKKHDIGLDCIRVFAMLAVILVHVGGTLNIPEKIHPLFSWGAAGVQFFFVLSGYLAASSFQRETKVFDYYRKRVLRIIPAYYMIVLLVMLYNEFILLAVPKDIYGIGWFRYFLGLNMIIPSANFDVWNNIYGLWTMSCFIWFYIFAPVIFKFVRSFKRSIYFFIVSIGVAVVWKILIMLLFSHNIMLEKIDVLSGGSPFGTLYQFAVGIVIFFAMREKKENSGFIFLAMLAGGGIILQKEILIWCCVCAMLILGFQNMEINCKGIEKFIIWLSRESFHIYLAHLLAFDFSRRIIIKWDIYGRLKCVSWILGSIVIITILCFLMDLLEANIYRHTDCVKKIDNN